VRLGWSVMVLAHIEAARGGDVSGNEEEGNEEGCQEEEVTDEHTCLSF